MVAIITTAIVAIIVSVTISTAIMIRITVEILKQSTDMLMKEFEENHNECMQFYINVSELLKRIQ